MKKPQVLSILPFLSMPSFLYVVEIFECGDDSRHVKPAMFTVGGMFKSTSSARLGLSSSHNSS
jgi:hypothetical protein